jgi:hypothetical protein
MAASEPGGVWVPERGLLRPVSSRQTEVAMSGLASDCQGELIECGRRPPVRLLVSGQLVMASPEVPDESVSSSSTSR